MFLSGEELVSHCRLALEKREDAPKYIGMNFKDGRAVAIKDYRDLGQGREAADYSGPKAGRSSEFVVTKTLCTAEARNKIKSYERAFSDALLLACEKDFDTVVNANGDRINPLFDLGILRENGKTVMLKYYLYVERPRATDYEDISDLIRTLTGDAVCFENGLAKSLYALGFRSQLLGVNRSLDGKTEFKLYFDMGGDVQPRSALDITKDALEALETRTDLTAGELEEIYEIGLYMRGIGLNPCSDAGCRLYFDRRTGEAPRRKLFG